MACSIVVDVNLEVREVSRRSLNRGLNIVRNVLIDPLCGVARDSLFIRLPFNDYYQTAALL